MEISLQGKNILITGGTGTVGRAAISEMLACGGNVFFTYRNDEQTAQGLQQRGACGFKVDLHKRPEIKIFLEKIKNQISCLDILIHNAVAIRDKTIVKASPDEWDYVLEVDLSSIYFLTKLIFPLLYKSRQGKIINIASQVGLHGAFGQASYAAAKGGLIALTKTLAKELGRKKILVNAINPGFMRSNITHEVPAAVVEENSKRSCLSQLSDPEELARVIAFISSDNVTGISGQVFPVDSRIF